MRTPESMSYHDYDVFIGLDVDKKSYAFTTIIHGIPRPQSGKVAADPGKFMHFVEKYYSGKKVVLAYEAGPTGYDFYDAARAKKYPCLVTPSSTMYRRSNERVKNNRLDSSKIAEQLEAGSLCGNRVPEGAYREIRHLVEMRENYVEKRRQAKQRIKSLLLFEHLEPASDEEKGIDKGWSREYFEKLKNLACTPSVKFRLDSLIKDHEYACQELLGVYRLLRDFCVKNSEIAEYVRCMRSIPGIGLVTATTILGRIGDPALLKHERELGCFIGLTPRERSTGDQVHQSHISGFGDNILRSLLIEAAWIAILKDKELRQFYERIKSKHHPKYAAKVAITAVARKLTMRIHCVLKNKRTYLVH